MADERVTLYETSHWRVIARLERNGDVTFSSGDWDNEWLAVVAAADRRRLIDAVAEDPASADAAASAAGVLALLQARFGRESSARRGPFEDIKAFLDERAIPWRHEFWAGEDA